MQIELIGCTSAGKSTLAKKMLTVARQSGIDLQFGDDFVIQQIIKREIHNRILRVFVVDIASFSYCLLSWRQHYKYYFYAFQTIYNLQIKLLKKLNLARNIFKKIGIYEIIRRRASHNQNVLVDEGTLHAAHNLFVSAAEIQNTYDISQFTRLTPFPDITVYLRQDKSALIYRTIKRRHKRIPDNSRRSVERFVNRAVAIFDELAQQPEVNKRLITIQAAGDLEISIENQKNPQITPILDILQSSSNTSSSNGMYYTGIPKPVEKGV